MTAAGRQRTLAIGCFLEAQLQGLLFGNEPGTVAGMSRPKAVLQVTRFGATKLTFNGEDSADVSAFD
jgi:hypothetical protein